MSTKDPKYGAACPICGDYLPGSDDAHMVYDGVAHAAEQGMAGNCGLCGEECTLEQTKAIAANSPPDTGIPYVKGY